MTATALIKFTQDALIGVDGEVLVGTTGSTVNVFNSSNTDVQSWQIDLLYTPPDSSVSVSIPLAFDNNNDTPTATFIPDVRGSYRLQLKVWGVPNRVGTPDVDIRNFCVPGNLGFIIPPYQKDPDPLPSLASGLPGAKPNEMNINGHEFGWLGSNLDSMLFDFMDNIPFFVTGVVYATGPSTDQAIALYNGTSGQVIEDSGVTISSVISSATTAATSAAIAAILPINLGGGGSEVTGTLPAGNQASQAMGGDCSGTTGSCTVGKLKGTSIGSVGGALTTGAVLRVTGPASADYGQVDLADSNAVTGTLPAAHQDPQSMGGDCSGTTSSCTVGKVNGTTYPAGGALTTGQVPRVTGVASVAYGALDLANTSATTGLLPRTSVADPSVVTLTGASNTLDITHWKKVLLVNNATATTLTVPTNASVAFPIGTEIPLFQYGAGQVTIAAAGGVTIRTPDVLVTWAQYAAARLRKIGTDEWEFISFVPGVRAPITANASRDFALSDMVGKIMSGNVTLTVRLDATVNFPIGTTIEGICTATQTSFAAEGGVTLNVASSFVAKARVTGSQWSLYKSAANTWWLTGDLDFS